jgi:hypothetical protein
LDVFVNLVENLILEADEATAFVFHVGPIRRAVKEQFGLKPDQSGAGGLSYEILYALVDGKEVCNALERELLLKITEADLLLEYPHLSTTWVSTLGVRRTSTY